MQITEANATESFNAKPPAIRDLINQALYVLTELGMPLENLSSRRLERVAMAFLAVANIKISQDWTKLKDANDHRSLRTRDIITFINTYFAENISMGSYDDIRRKDLLLSVASNIIIQTSPNSARNNSMRGYAINPEFASVIRTFQPHNWHEPKDFMRNRQTLTSKLHIERAIKKMSVMLPTGVLLELSPGEHNILQKAVIEEFLPRYGYNAQILYVGDTAKKFLILETNKLEELQFFSLDHGELPDIIAYSSDRNWIYLIEAVHSSGPISSMRLLKLKELTRSCKAAIIYVTAFLDRGTFRRFISDIAWETEVWIAKDPDHIIHFNGDKFLGPYI